MHVEHAGTPRTPGQRAGLRSQGSTGCPGGHRSACKPRLGQTQQPCSSSSLPGIALPAHHILGTELCHHISGTEPCHRVPQGLAVPCRCVQRAGAMQVTLGTQRARWGQVLGAAPQAPLYKRGPSRPLQPPGAPCSWPPAAAPLALSKEGQQLHGFWDVPGALAGSTAL